MGKLEKLKLTEIHPEGWLKRQLQIQMNGLTGKLYDIWDSVGSYSGWLGGTGESWERAPYYLDGLVPLSYYLEDKEHWELCCRFIEWTLNSQQEDGNFGPKVTLHEQWSKFAMLKVLIQYEEITGDARVIPFAVNYLQYIADVSKKIKIREWSEARIPDLLYVAKWVYDRTQEEKILDLMRQIDQASLDWCDYLEQLPFPRPAAYYMNWKLYEDQVSRTALEDMAPYHATHIVNVAMGLKHPAVRNVYAGETEYYASVAEKGIGDLIRYHGVVSGCLNGDEHLAGNNPSQGSELCSIVEYMFSLQALLESFGSAAYADQMERLAYNALPATITEDFMAHQYLQQANQIMADDTERPWFNNSKESNMFGLEPNFGCCTANMHQGWPKFVNSLWYKEDSNTVVSMCFAPNTLKTRIGGEETVIELCTEYPFRDTLSYQIQKAPKKAITVKIRVPNWCEDFTIACAGAEIVTDKAAHMIVVTKAFQEGDQIEVRYPMEVTYSTWYHKSVAVERGPLVYGLNMKEKWVVKKEVAGVKDYCVYPESDWNYAIARDRGSVDVREAEISETPFSKEFAPVHLQVSAKKLAEWGLDGGNTMDLPPSPVKVNVEEVKIDLIPFGCTKLRISQFPYYEDKED